MNHCYDSEGNKYTTVQVERKIREAKKKRLQMQIDEIGYNVCEKCNRNDCLPIDCSHNVSVKWAKENNQAELCWDVNNITPLGRKCHKKHENNLIKSGKK